jgi:hypothetical protein
MTTLTNRFSKTRFVLALAGAGSLCCLSDIVQAADWNKHALDAALEIGQIAAPAPVGQVLEVVDTVRDTSAAAAGAATAYSVAGASGPAIMGKLAVVGGPVSVGTVSGFGVAGLQDKYLYSDCDHADACDAASVAGYVGAGAGMAGAAALGASYGLGASGLAAIGGLVGGGMAVGVAGLIALPAMGAVAIGAGVYGIASLLTD